MNSTFLPPIQTFHVRSKFRFAKIVFTYSAVFLLVSAAMPNLEGMDTSRLAVPEKISIIPAVQASGKVVYLTFDADMTYGMKRNVEAGLANYYDPELLKYLEDNHIAATFFVTGMFGEVYPDVVREIGANPNFAIGNHTYDHRAFTKNCYNLSAVWTAQDKTAEILSTQKIIQTLTGQAPKYFRYPGLCHSPADDTLVENLGLTINNNDIISADGFAHDPKHVANTVQARVREGSVVVMHPGGANAQATTSAIKIIIPKLQEMGYQFGKLQ